MKYTANYGFRKPEDADPVDIDDLNYNADTIDAKLKELEDWAEELDGDFMSVFTEQNQEWRV